MWSQLWGWNRFWCSCFWTNSSLHLACWCPGLFAVTWSEILPRSKGLLSSKVTANVCVGELSEKLALVFLGCDPWLTEVLGMAVAEMPPVRNNLSAETAGWCASVLWWSEEWLKQADWGCCWSARCPLHCESVQWVQDSWCVRGENSCWSIRGCGLISVVLPASAASGTRKCLAPLKLRPSSCHAMDFSLGLSTKD